MSRTLTFPKYFLWGAATSSYQVEGRIKDNDWAKAALEGKVPPAGLAADHYRRYEEDFDIAKSLGHNAHRLSIEWSRIEPEEGKFDRDAIEHYRKVLAALRSRGLTPLVTLWHFTLPLWLSEKGGVERHDFPEYLSRYCEYVAKELDLRDSKIITLNEPFVFSTLGWFRGTWPPFKRWSLFRLMLVTKHLVRAHNISYVRIKKHAPSCSIGVVKNEKTVLSGKSLSSRILGKIIDWSWNHWYLKQTYFYTDFIGLNYYFHQSLGREGNFLKSDFGWPIYPKGIYIMLNQLKRYHKPIYITENGIADAKDRQRAKFIKDHLYWVQRAIQDGVPVKGYFYWSLLDNFEWAEGFKMRFGLVEVNFETQERIIRSSAQVYKRICETNTLEY